jgi:hypothetical protein
MTKRTLVWVLTVISALLLGFLFLPRSSKSPEHRAVTITEQQTPSTQAGVSNSQIKNKEADQAEQNALELRQRVRDARRRYAMVKHKKIATNAPDLKSKGIKACFNRGILKPIKLTNPCNC